MPANLTPDYMRAEEQFKAARTPEEKLEALEQMMATIPKHKGTEKMRADIKRRMSKLKKEEESPRGGKRSLSYNVEKQGAGQIILIGPPNSGKTTLINTVTNADFATGDYAFTTTMFQPAMMPYENLQFQLVDTPAVDPQFYERWVFGIIRHGDLVLLIIDLGNPNLLDGIENVITILEEGRIYLTKEDVEMTEDYGTSKKKTIIVANRMDADNVVEHLEILQEFYGDRFPIYPISCLTEEGIPELKQAIFDSLNIVRVYTRSHGKKPDYEHPFILKKGNDVEYLAFHIHKDLARNMKFARIWGEGYYDGQAVDRNQELKDGDIIEIHT